MAGMRRGPLRLVFWAQFGLGDYRASTAGTAVCGLSGASWRPRLLGGLAELGAAVVLIGLWITASWSWPVWLVLLVSGWLYRPIIRHSFESIGARRRLRGVQPSRPFVTVHTVASSFPGAGAALLDEVVAEADERGWTMFLVAANERLAEYYECFGFRSSGDAVVMPTGELAVPMIRFVSRSRR